MAPATPAASHLSHFAFLCFAFCVLRFECKMQHACNVRRTPRVAPDPRAYSKMRTRSCAIGEYFAWVRSMKLEKPSLL